MEPTFFAAPPDFRAWLSEHHESDGELWVGFHKKASGRQSITWPQSVDEALCFGWIDGKRVSIDETSYAIRFTPRKPRSVWSRVNIARVGELEREGRMRPAGLAAFARRTEERSGTASYEQQGPIALDEAQEREFRDNSAAWQWFSGQAPWYRRAATWWVVSAKREDTRRRRLAQLIEDSAHGRTVGPLTRPGT